MTPLRKDVDAFVKLTGTISALDIDRMLHAAASPRDWSVHEETLTNGELVVYIYDHERRLIGTMQGAKARENANLVVHLRNVLPEHIKAFEHLIRHKRLLERRNDELAKELLDTEKALMAEED